MPRERLEALALKLEPALKKSAGKAVISFLAILAGVLASVLPETLGTKLLLGWLALSLALLGWLGALLLISQAHLRQSKSKLSTKESAGILNDESKSVLCLLHDAYPNPVSTNFLSDRLGISRKDVLIALDDLVKIDFASPALPLPKSISENPIRVGFPLPDLREIKPLGIRYLRDIGIRT